ncbi:MAG: hypothetical protein AVO33_07500 [delta proteobacterium ML8_F1]|nr:MAG: hypothetical protein AVO33_07500 [delta proteobacterium ML8_F1]
MAKSLKTEELDEILKHSSSIDSYLEEFNFVFKEMAFKEYMESLLLKYNMRVADIIKKTEIDRTYAYQIVAGNRRASRDKLLQIALAVCRELEEVQTLLKVSGYSPLYTKVKRDTIIKYGIEKHLEVSEINQLLYEYYEKPLYEKD